MRTFYPVDTVEYLECFRLTVFRNGNTWNTSWKSFVFAEIHIKIVKHLLKCYFKHIFINLAASKRAKHTVLENSAKKIHALIG